MPVAPTRRPTSLLRRARRIAAALGLASGLTLQATATTPHPPPPQVAGVYRLPLGRLQVTALFDGTVALPLAHLRGIGEQQARALLRDQYVPELAHGLQTSVNAYLIQNGDRLILVDTGAQACFGPGLGQVLGNLQAAGYAADQVDDILITHAHPDHLCGILDAQGKTAYPNATLWLAREDADYWLDKARETDPATPAFFRPLFAMVRNATAPYRLNGRLRLFAANDRLPDGVTLLASHGHTPGHSAYLFDGGAGQALLVWGDSLHYRAIQFPHPEVSYLGDADQARAVASRKRLLSGAVHQRWWIGAAHLPFPGLGHVRREGSGYAWVPAEFSPLPAPSDSAAQR
jgi:glyoxylase-like metal-dependent hydrolase (beta-lactamase superfamily II)